MTDDDQTDASEDPAPEPALTLDVKTLKIAGAAILGVVLFVLVAAAIVNQLGDQPQTGAFATVDGVNITYEDVQQRQSILESLGRPTQDEQTLKELLIDEQLLVNEAQARNLIPSRDNVSSTINNLIEQNNINRSRYEQRLTSQGLNWSDLETYFAQREGIDAVIRELGSNQTVSNETLRETYEANRESFEQPRQAQVRHILLTQPDEANDSTEELARRLLQQARDGEDFCELVDEYSEDPGSQQTCGEYNITRDSQFVQAFIDAAFNMTDGEYRLVNSSFGYHVMYKVGEISPRTQSFDEVRDQLRDQYLRQQEITRITRVIEDLRANATITVYEDSLQNKTQVQDVQTIGNNTPTNTSEASTNETTEQNQTTTTTDGADQTETTTDAPDTLPACLEEANAALYTTSWSPDSQGQIDELGDAANNVTQYDCSGDDQATCEQAGITTYPTWELDGDQYEGYKTRTWLRNTLSCPS
jgi:parvulin-like peptidyl-prolyl isomerase